MERIKEDRPITIKDDKGNLNRCIADIVSVRSSFNQSKWDTRARRFQNEMMECLCDQVEHWATRVNGLNPLANHSKLDLIPANDEYIEAIYFL